MLSAAAAAATAAAGAIPDSRRISTLTAATTSTARAIFLITVAACSPLAAVTATSLHNNMMIDPQVSAQLANFAITAALSRNLGCLRCRGVVFTYTALSASTTRTAVAADAGGTSIGAFSTVTAITTISILSAMITSLRIGSCMSMRLHIMIEGVRTAKNK